MAASVILHNIRSAHNVGAIFRTADGAGVSKVYLTGYTPAPVDRFGRPNSEIEKTSLGAANFVSYEFWADPALLIKTLKDKGWRIVAVEQTPNAIDYQTFSPPREVAYVFGNEITGIESNVLRLCDTHIMIPMRGAKESLNVSVAAGIILFNARQSG